MASVWIIGVLVNAHRRRENSHISYIVFQVSAFIRHLVVLLQSPYFNSQITKKHPVCAQLVTLRFVPCDQNQTDTGNLPSRGLI